MLKKAQRGDTVEGWNDCPTSMLTGNATSGSRTKRKVQRVGHVINGLGIEKERGKVANPTIVLKTENLSQKHHSSPRNHASKEDILHRLTNLLKHTSLQGNEVDSVQSDLLEAYVRISQNDRVLYNTILSKIEQLAENPNLESIEITKKEISIFRTVENEVSSCCTKFLIMVDNLKI